eukprot:gene669-biopygen3693
MFPRSGPRAPHGQKLIAREIHPETDYSAAMGKVLDTEMLHIETVPGYITEMCRQRVLRLKGTPIIAEAVRNWRDSGDVRDVCGLRWWSLERLGHVMSRAPGMAIMGRPFSIFTTTPLNQSSSPSSRRGPEDVH